MDAFTTHLGKVALLDWSDVNTDLIIPARYLKRVERTGYGPLLFADKKYVPGGAPEPDAPERHGPLADDFPLNRTEAKGATILVVGRNFGCGSSREHAVWAVQQAGYRALIAPIKGEGFADIFEGNAYNNGLLPIELPEADWKAIADLSRSDPDLEATIDLKAGTIHLHPSKEGEPAAISFDVSEGDRHRLLLGLDAIGETLQHDAKITSYEQQAAAWAASPGA
ncbi:3-isopropylmalate dehydratase small subunit [Tautonia rosea]|uniref:3-isopropylmalate dehydratase small subunit n=1 Tax=Tautonia rosea TaxID=2728037 RepID=UPI001474F05B|nr:3-isopropylmalate dehydratase small subunit [Tautonia rosea]